MYINTLQRLCVNQWIDTSTLNHAVGAKPELALLGAEASKLTLRPTHLH